MKQITFAAVTGFALSCASSSYACIALPTPFDPSREKYDVAIVGKVTNDVATSGFARADLKVERVVSGQFSYPTYPLSYYVYDGRGMCPPPGPYLKKGQRVTLYLAKAPPNSMTSKTRMPFYSKGWRITP